MTEPYDAVLLVSFGGPEKPGDVIPFLENVTRGTGAAKERILEVAKRYDLFEGVSPANAENRALLAALVTELNTHGPRLPVYWGNRHWHPLLADTLRQMADDGIRRALAFVTSAFGSYSTCRQYLEDIERARQAVGPDAPEVDKLRLFYNHPGFIEPMRDRVAAALEEVPAERRGTARIIYTAHSIPVAMAEKCDYQEQLREACRLVSEGLGRSDWQLVYQSRSGPPRQPWLGPELADYLRELAAPSMGHGRCPTGPFGGALGACPSDGTAGKVDDVVIAPIGFLYEQMEVVYDLDHEVARLCHRLGLNMVRSAVVAADPRLVTMIRELILERIDWQPTRLALGTRGPSHDVCPPDCCPRG